MITEKSLYLWLTMAGVSAKKGYRLIEQFGGLFSLHSAIRSKRIPLMHRDFLAEINKLYAVSDDDISKELDLVLDKGISVITPDSPIFPEPLKHIYDPPLLLTALGDLDLLKSRCIAMVGTRDCSEYGSKCAKLFASELASAGLTIVSGMALGIDTLAHKATLDVNGKTIAVLGGGFDRIYPASNFSLFKTIAKKGLVLSEYLPATNATPYTFPLRNRLISGLSEGVLVVEGGLGSGSLITAECAIEQHRELFVIPGRIDSPTSAGSNKLLFAMQGCIVIEPNNILERLGITKIVSQKIDKITLDSYEDMVYNFLRKKGKAHLNELCAEFKMSVTDMNGVLFSLEEKRLVTKQYGNIYTA